MVLLVHKCLEITESISLLMHAVIEVQDLNQQWEQIFIRALIPCSINKVYPHMLKTLKATTHTNRSKIGTPLYYVVKTLKHGNNPQP
jgi:hypothetical protein